jgi:hypothetical protein
MQDGREQSLTLEFGVQVLGFEYGHGRPAGGGGSASRNRAQPHA